MNIGYIKLDKLNKIQYIFRNTFKIINKQNNCYYIPSNNKKILNKLKERLEKDKIDYIVKEEGINCEYKEPNGKYIVKYILPEIVKECLMKLEKEEKLEEIYICVEKFTKENIQIVEEMCENVKVVNIVTSNIRQFQELEKRLEKREVYITVSNNKRKSLKRANVIVNIDFDDFKSYNVNRNSIIINTKEEFNLLKDFEGICIERVEVCTNKVMRIFSEMENINKSKLIETEIMKLKEYLQKREMIKTNKLEIRKIYGRRNEIESKEFENMKRNFNQRGRSFLVEN